MNRQKNIHGDLFGSSAQKVVSNYWPYKSNNGPTNLTNKLNNKFARLSQVLMLSYLIPVDTKDEEENTMKP